MIANPTSATLVGLCLPNSPSAINDYTALRNSQSVAKVFEADCPSKSDSWVSYRPKVELITDHQTVALHSTGPADTYQPQTLRPDSDSKGTEYKSASGQSEGSRRQPVSIHTRGPAHFRVRFYGTAIRVRHKIPKPDLIKYGGADVSRPVGKGKFKHWTIGGTEKCPTYKAEWSQEYELYSAPKGDLIESDPDVKEFPQ